MLWDPPQIGRIPPNTAVRVSGTTSELATAGAAKVLGVDHSATKALAKASITMAKADLWQARLAVKTLRRDQREAIAEAAED